MPELCVKKDIIWSRRSFLKAALAGAALLAARPAFPEELVMDEDEHSEGGAIDAGAEPQAAEPQAEVIRRKRLDLPEGRLIIYSPRTDEELDVVYRDEYGEFDPEALKAINHFMRCHHTDKVIDMDVNVIEYLNALDKRLGGGNRIHVISGYRSPEYNALLRRRSRRVAKHSFHLSGRAIDLRIPGVKLKNMKRAAMTLKCGGVGYYPRRGFLHIDSGPVRHW